MPRPILNSGLLSSSRRYRRHSLAGYYNNNNNNNSSSNNNNNTAAAAAYNSVWWHRGEREMRHAEAGCLMAPILMLPLFGSWLPLPAHLAIVFVHAFVVVPFAAGIYPPTVLDAVKAKLRLLWTRFVDFVEMILTTWKLYSIVAVMVAVKLYNKKHCAKYFNQMAFLHLIGTASLYSVARPLVIFWNYLLCVILHVIRSRYKDKMPKIAQNDLFWSILRSFLMLVPVVEDAKLVGVVYVVASEVYAYDRTDKNLILTLAQFDNRYVRVVLDYWEALEATGNAFLPLTSFYFWVVNQENTSFPALLALLYNVVMPSIGMLENLQDQMVLLHRLMNSVKLQSISDDFCTICQSQISKTSIGAKTPCKHSYHMWCLWALFRNARGIEYYIKEIKCPNCNAQI